MAPADLNPRPFEYHSPPSVKDTIALLEKYGGDAKLLAGGQSLIPLMKLRLASPSHVIDLGRIVGLDYIRREEGHFTIGSLATMAELEDSGALRKWCAIIPECAAHVADPLVRNLGTIGGNISHADPSNDMPAVMVATGAVMMAAGPKGIRSIQASEFFIDTFTTALREDELLVEVRVPVGRHLGGSYMKLERQAGEFGVVGVAAGIGLTREGRCGRCGIALTGAGPTVIEAKRAEKEVVGTNVSVATIEKASALAAEEARPIEDLRGTEQYKREMVKVLTRRALLQALKRARSGQS